MRTSHFNLSDRERHSSSSMSSSGLVENNSYQISPRLRIFLQNAPFGLVRPFHTLVWSTRRYNQPVINTQLSLGSQLSLDRWLYRRTTLFKLLELYAIYNQGSSREKGWLMDDPVLSQFFPEVKFPIRTNRFLIKEITSCSESPSSNYTTEDELIDQSYQHACLSK